MFSARYEGKELPQCKRDPIAARRPDRRDGAFYRIIKEGSSVRTIGIHDQKRIVRDARDAAVAYQAIAGGRIRRKDARAKQLELALQGRTLLERRPKGI